MDWLNFRSALMGRMRVHPRKLGPRLDFPGVGAFHGLAWSNMGRQGGKGTPLEILSSTHTNTDTPIPSLRPDPEFSGCMLW